jgi:hypothetical protein
MLPGEIHSIFENSLGCKWCLNLVQALVGLICFMRRKVSVIKRHHLQQNQTTVSIGKDVSPSLCSQPYLKQ